MSVTCSWTPQRSSFNHVRPTTHAPPATASVNSRGYHLCYRGQGKQLPFFEAAEAPTSPARIRLTSLRALRMPTY
jgi:hypothetical protein